tara:strand:- start:2868 stop:3104 length:237 start_codon:yes stop_codon:yes gene_type:complete
MTLDKNYNMSLRTTLRNNKTVRGRRWTIRKDKEGFVSEVKMIFKPEEYEKFKSARTMYGDKDLLNLLEQNYEKKKNNS